MAIDLIPSWWGRGALRGLRSPLDLLGRFPEDWWDEMDKQTWLAAGKQDGFIVPRLDLVEGDSELVVSAELPGVDEKEIDLTLERDRMILKAEKKEDKEERREGYFLKERRYRGFYREIPLPCEVETQKAQAVFKKGVLKVTLPKAPEELKKGQKVLIKGA